MTTTLVHRFAGTAGATPVNAYVVEGANELALVDTTLLVSDGEKLREFIKSLGKPLRGIAITHAHPDHYGALVEVNRDAQAPVYATKGVIDVIRRDDPIKEQILRPMFGDEWAQQRAFPDTEVADGQIVEVGGIRLRVTDIGPGESPADSIWTLEDEPTHVFIGDLAYGRMHCYLADGFFGEWLSNIETLKKQLPADVTLHPGHGEPGGIEMLDWETKYLNVVIDATKAADWSKPDDAKAEVIAKVSEFLPTTDLRFLMELSLDSLSTKLGLR